MVHPSLSSLFPGLTSTQGNEKWLEALDSKFHNEFASTKSTPFVIYHSGKVAGEVRSAGGAGHTAGNVTFVNIHEAGYVSAPLYPLSIIHDSYVT